MMITFYHKVYYLNTYDLALFNFSTVVCTSHPITKASVICIYMEYPLKWFVCPHCAKHIRTSVDVMLHCADVHASTWRHETVYPCQFCPNIFGNLKQFDRHVYLHDQSRPYACNTCTLRYDTSECLDRHAKLAHTICQGCGLPGVDGDYYDYKYCKLCGTHSSNRQ